jgi:hypothetical protein
MRSGLLAQQRLPAHRRSRRHHHVVYKYAP